MSEDLTKPRPTIEDGKAQSGGQASLYHVVSKKLQEEIVRGIHPVGSLLPSETVLMKRFGVSRQTVRGAVRSLREMGLVESHQGLGTRVKSLGSGKGYIHHVATIGDFFPSELRTQYDAVVSASTSLPDAVRTAVNSTERDWLHIQGLRFRIDSKAPVNEFDIYVAMRFAAVGRILNAHSGPVYAAIEMLYGETIGRVQQVIRGFVADGSRGSALSLPKGEAGIEVEGVFHLTSDNTAAIVSLNRYRVGDFSFSMTLQRMDV